METISHYLPEHLSLLTQRKKELHGPASVVVVVVEVERSGDHVRERPSTSQTTVRLSGRREPAFLSIDGGPIVPSHPSHHRSLLLYPCLSSSCSYIHDPHSNTLLAAILPRLGSSLSTGSASALCNSSDQEPAETSLRSRPIQQG